MGLAGEIKVEEAMRGIVDRHKRIPVKTALQP